MLPGTTRGNDRVFLGSGAAKFFPRGAGGAMRCGTGVYKYFAICGLSLDLSGQLALAEVEAMWSYLQPFV